jgi:uncharacterized protein (DUF1778 family)
MGVIDSGKRAAKRSETINLRVSSTDLSLIDNAAAATGKTRTDFLLDSARRHAVDLILDQTVFRLDAPSTEAFMKALDEPTPPGKKLKELMSRKPVWTK